MTNRERREKRRIKRRGKEKIKSGEAEVKEEK